MTEAEIQKIEKRLAEATPWKPYEGAASQEWHANKENNAELCQYAFVDLKALLDERKRLREVVEFAKQKFHYIKDEYCERRHNDVIRDVLAKVKEMEG